MRGPSGRSSPAVQTHVFGTVVRGALQPLGRRFSAVAGHSAEERRASWALRTEHLDHGAPKLIHREGLFEMRELHPIEEAEGT
jgi:hypothetical protein